MNETMKRIREHQKASNNLWRELEKQGYHSGGCDSKFNENAIIEGKIPDAKIVGYVNVKTLSIRWINKSQ